MLKYIGPYCWRRHCIILFAGKNYVHPKRLPPDYKFQFNFPFKEINIPFNKKDNLNLVQFFPDQVSKGVVLYFHGNRENINRYAKYAANFTKHGYEVWMTDYPGFGKTTGINRRKCLQAGCRNI